jgi:hypothetical protein
MSVAIPSTAGLEIVNDIATKSMRIPVNTSK